MEAEIENATKEYTNFINDLIKKDPRFIERVSYLEKSLFNVLGPQVDAANKIKTKSNIRAKRMKAPLFGAEGLEESALGFGLSNTAIINWISGSGSLKLRQLEQLLGFEPFEISDAMTAGWETIRMDSSRQSHVMGKFVDEVDKYNSFGFNENVDAEAYNCLLYTSPSPRDRTRSRMPSSA